MVTIYDIAKHCGVSGATVSKALNNNSGVSEKTREYIKDTAKQMGYLPNAQARSLATKRSKNIGVLFYDDTKYGLTHQFFSQILESLRYEVEEKGYDLFFIAVNSVQFKHAYYEHCRHKGIDGAVIVSVDFDDEQVLKLVNSEIPVVLIDKVIEGKTSILSKNYEGTRKAIHYLYRCGHRKIGFVHGQLVSNMVTDERKKGFYQGMAECGLEIDENWIQTGRYYDYVAVKDVVKKMLKKEDRPTVLLLPDDYAALGAYKAISELELRIPEDVSLVGHDGLELAEILTPTLTTIAQHSQKIGQHAGEQIVRLIESSNPQQKIIEVETKLQVRDSVKDFSKRKE